MIRVRMEGSLEGFRDAARALLRAGVRPEQVDFEDPRSGQTVLGETLVTRASEPEGSSEQRVMLPAAFLGALEKAVYHRDPDRFSLFYRIAYRLSHGERSLLALSPDPDVSRLRALLQAVERDEHRMHAYVRFRCVKRDDHEHFIAWYRPEHPILRLTAPFFRNRFPNLRWSILTPDESAHWDGTTLIHAAGAPRSSAPSEDELEQLFAAYYAAIFNPARLNLKAMRAHLPSRHRRSLPEIRNFDELVRSSRDRVATMQVPAPSAAQAELPREESLEALRVAAAQCSACPLHEHATRTVFGEGPGSAQILLVGEQPGDEEDLAGRPFVGPAGRVLDRALNQAGIARSSVYLTNAVKHFRWKADGKRRLHDRPRPGDVRACRAWLDAEIRAVRPQVIVCLGATAAQSFLGSRFSVTRYRGHWFDTPWAKNFVVTYHPAAILRLPDPDASAHAFADLVAHLVAARERLERDHSVSSP